MNYLIDNKEKMLKFSKMDDRQLVYEIINGNNNLAAFFLKKKCYTIFDYINKNRLNDLMLDVDDLVNDFYIYIQENDWEKLKSFRFESKLQTWINMVASRYLFKKYSKELQESSCKETQIEGLNTFLEDNNTLVRAELLDAITKLNDNRDQMVLLLTIQGYDANEISKKIGTNINNVYTIKSRAIEKLKNYYE